MCIWYLLVFSAFLPGSVAMQMVHSAIYHFPLTLLRHSFTIFVPPCTALFFKALWERHSFFGSLASGWGKTACVLLVSEATDQYLPLGRQLHASLNFDLSAPEQSQDAN